MREITTASEEQSAGSTQIDAAMDQLNQITQQNASSSEELAATAEEMSEQAEQLKKLMAFFKVGDGGMGIVSQSTPKSRKARSLAGKVAELAMPLPQVEFVKF